MKGIFVLQGYKRLIITCLGLILCLHLPAAKVQAAVASPKVASVHLEDGSGDERAEEQSRIVDAAVNGGITIDSYNDCPKWIWLVLQAAGFENVPYWCGARYWDHFASEEHADPTLMPEGAIVIGTGWYSDIDGTGYHYGHIGICVQNDNGEILIRDCTGPGSSHVRTWTLEEWETMQIDSYIGYEPHDPGFVGWVYYPDIKREEFTWP